MNEGLRLSIHGMAFRVSVLPLSRIGGLNVVGRTGSGVGVPRTSPKF